MSCSEWLRRLQVFLVLAVVNGVFAGYAVLAKVVLSDGLDAGVFVLLRDTGAGLFLLLVARLKAGKWVWPDKEDRLACVFLGLFGVYFGQYYLVLGLDQTDAVTTSLWTNTAPVFTFAWGVALGREILQPKRLNFWMKITGLVLSIGGAVFASVTMAIGASSSGDSSSGSGKGSMVLGCVYFFCLECFGSLFYYLQKHLLDKGYAAIHVTAWGYACGTCFMLMVIFPRVTELNWRLSVLDIVAVASVVFLTSSLCYFLLAWANQRTNPILVVALSPLQIIFTILLEFVFFGDAPEVFQICGAVAIVVGLALFVYSKLQENAEETKDLLGTEEESDGGSVQGVNV
eukprot:TRINITY_DN1316_c8_g1_i1.p1 TRINITY_DN1316_c8_g1~~TRINITY_DN1316_c8_g1_i1.p1  ORF type:complete len:364 (+),score=62.56 TRINITY_DN1316_c8_g1_i1:62-1093(+)